MLKNYFKTAFRNLWKHRVFSLINILGLATGMTASFLVLLYVRFECSYDRFHEKGDRIYRVVADIKTPTETIKASGPAWAVPPHLKLDMPEIESFVRLAQQNMLVRKGEIKFQEERAQFADSGFFQVFSFKLLKGNPKTVLREPLSVVFSETTAKKYFGHTDPIGQTVLITGDGLPAKVTGIMQDLPENSMIQADMLVSMSTVIQKMNPGLDDQWGNYGSRAYVLLKPGTNPKTLEAKMPGFMERRDGDEMRQSKMYATLFLEPLKRVYLYSTRGDATTGNIVNVYVFSVVAVFILLIACINFVNLTTARSVERAKEVGVRKVIGALRQQLARQFIVESILLCVIAFLLTIILSAFLAAPFNRLAEKTVISGIFTNPYELLILLLAAIVIGLLAGLYPASVLSAFRPVVVLKGRFSSGSKGTLLRKSLVVTQFTISIGFIISTLVVYNQLKYMRSQSLGFSKDQILVMDTNGDPGRDALKQAALQIPGVRSAALSSSVPGGGNPAAYSQIENQKGDMQVANLALYFVDWDYIPLFKIDMAAGRPFDRSFASDTTHAMILNEAAVKMFGYTSPAQAIGRRFNQWDREGTIVGVMKNFHFRSLQQDIEPLSMRIEPNGCSLLSLHVSAGHLPATLAALETQWKKLIPDRPFDYYFMDAFFDKQYKGEERFGKLFLDFAVFAIFISCLGLLGLASYSTFQRTKEIGIRKTMGASVMNILHLLSKGFLKLVFLSFVIASPVAWWFMRGWLNHFAYRSGISVWVFVLACGLALLVAMVTISVQALRAAMANPIASLRSE